MVNKRSGSCPATDLEGSVDDRPPRISTGNCDSTTDQQRPVELDDENADVQHSSDGNGEKPPTLTPMQKTASKAKRTKKPKRRSSARGTAGDSDAEELKSRFLKRSDKNEEMRAKKGKMETERGPVVRQRMENAGSLKPADEAIYDVVNPSTYDKLFARLEETHFNKATKPDGVSLDNTPWICCFCQRKPCVDDLGDLFGPYYVKLSYPAVWPPYVNRDEKTTTASGASGGSGQPDVYADLWFHGDCIFWAPGILLRGSGMTGLDEYLPNYWNQKCSHCREPGASMACAVKGCSQRYHYPCAVSTESTMKESTYLMYCESHKKFAEKRK